jgi:hypothetical protein
MATKKKKYLFAVQRASGHEVVSATLEVAKVSDVEAQHLDSGLVRIVAAGDVVATSASYIDAGEELTLHRWVADDTLTEPVSSKVKATSEE